MGLTLHRVWVKKVVPRSILLSDCHVPRGVLVNLQKILGAIRDLRCAFLSGNLLGLIVLQVQVFVLGLSWSHLLQADLRGRLVRALTVFEVLANIQITLAINQINIERRRQIFLGNFLL